MSIITNNTSPGPAEVKKPSIWLIDGSNVAHGAHSKPKISKLKALLEQLERFDIRVVTFVDATLIYKIDDRDELEALIQRGIINQVPAHRTADQFIIDYASRLKATGSLVYVVTNDISIEEKVGSDKRVAFVIINNGDAPEVLLNPSPESILGLQSNPSMTA